MCDNPCDEIINNLFLGSANALQTKKDFTMIVNCTRNTDIPFPKYCNNCIRVPIDDDPDHSNLLLSLITETNVLGKMHDSLQKKEFVLVHCFAGMQRSCALVACYLIKYYNMHPNDAINYIKTKRPMAFFGNVNFMTAIELFYETL